MPNACCVVLARGGSKRIPHKNIRPFNGLPMVAWPIQAALASGLFSSVFISTDAQNIEEVACTHGATSLGMRPPHLADDFSTTAQVLAHFCQELTTHGHTLPEHLCCLYGTSAFITPALLRTGFETLQESPYHCALAVSRYSHPIERALVFDPAGKIQYINEDKANTRTQDCIAAYHDIGLFYWLRVAPFLALETPGFAPLAKTAIIVAPNKAMDIDTEEDWALAEQMMQRNTQKP